MGTLGERFRRQRELQAIPLSEVAAKTHIGTRLLQAIEEESYERLPGGIFNKSFIRQYAEYLGLDPEQAVRDYVRSTAGRLTQQMTTPEPRAAFVRDGGRSMTWVAVAAVVVAVVGFGGYMVRRHSAQPAIAKSEPALRVPRNANPAPQMPANPAPSAPTAKRSSEPLSIPPDLGPVNAEGEPIQQAQQSSQAAGSPQSAPSTQSPLSSHAAPATTFSAQPSVLASANASGMGELLLQINAHSSVWISVTADGEKKWQGTLQANQSREIQATDTIRLTAGNAGGISLTLNGKDIGAMGGEGEVKTITLAARALGDPVP